jgi:chemosensory pili system protein ChpA (sensor histidine kinase/response regulator)
MLGTKPSAINLLNAAGREDMTSHDPEQNQDNWFDDEMEGIFNDLNSEDSNSSLDNDLDDLVNLFDDDFPDAEPSAPLSGPLSRSTQNPQRMSLSLDSPNAELEALFSENPDLKNAELDPYETSSWLDFGSIPDAEPMGTHAEADSGAEDSLFEIDDLFDDGDIHGETISFEKFTDEHSTTVTTSELDDLRDLLGFEEEPVIAHHKTPIRTTPTRTQEKISVSAAQISPSLDLSKPLPVFFYDGLETLETLISQPPLLANFSNLDIKSLEALIDAPCQVPDTVAPKVVVPQPVAPRAIAVSKQFDTETEDEFKDLEALLEQADRTMGGPPTMVTVGGQRLQPRNRPAKTKSFEQTMRVPVKQLDNLSNLIGELVVKRNRLEQDQERLRQFLDNLLTQSQNLSDVGGRMQDLYERTLLEGALLASRSPDRSNAKTTFSGSYSTFSGGSNDGLDALEMDRFTGFHLLSQEMIELIVRVRESSSDIQYLVDETDQVARSLRQVTTQLQEGMTKSRMVSFAQTADRLPRAIREVSMKLNKQVKLQVEGREVLVDKMILEHLYNPMTHLVNNAITHGIESPEVRRKKGKPTEGKITIRAFLQGNQTLIIVSDDGAGIDAEQVKRKAVEKGLMSQFDVNLLTEQEVYELLFHAGFSTKDQADDFSGRGVGLDVVRTSLLDVRGSVTIDSTLGQGTTFNIRLPLTLSICKALCCLSDRARIAFPMDGVEDTKDYLPSDIVQNEEGQNCIPWNDALLPIYRLQDLLSYHRQLSRGSVYGGKPEEDIVAIVILRGGGSNLLAIQVDQVVGEEEIVIKQIEGPIPKPPGIAGATVRGDGTIMPIGDAIELIEIAQGRMRVDTGSSLWRKTIVPNLNEAQIEPTVLIIDDSITVRELLSLSFGKAGYRVEQARDGQEAWEKLRSGLPCDLVFCDIEMPRMNGLELLSHLQNDEQLSNIPVALLTSRGADRHRKVAAKLGASGYFTKPYTEKDIIDAAKRMIQGEILLQGSVKQPHSFISRFKQNQAKQTMPGQATPSSLDDEDITPKVLIIDDSVMVREMLSLTYRKAGYRPEVARDGQDAWEKLRSGLLCDLILCDIEMPRMNGLELLDRIQEDPNLSKIPIAMITSRGAQKMQRLAAEKGAKGYFVKPYIEDALLEASQRLMAGEVLLDPTVLAED